MPVMLRKQWENMPFKTPFYINVINEGIILPLRHMQA